MSGSGLLADLEREAHLWIAPAGPPARPEVAEAWWRLLSSAEREAYRRFRVEAARRQHLAARVLVRTALSRYAEVPPERWTFRRGRHGRPAISGPPEAPAMEFNLSHTRGLVVCLIGRGGRLGVDVEHVGEERSCERLAERFFSPEEAADVLARPAGAERRRRFYAYWTLKESYLKARGAGLSVPLRRVVFRLPDGGGLEVRFARELGERAADWRFALLRPSPDHLAAVALGAGDRRIIARRIAPLVEVGPPESLPVVAAGPPFAARS